jgi:hypothetical protein
VSEVQIFRKLMIGAVTVLVIGAGASFAANAASPDVQPARFVQDVKGPCDEAEHANDPQCAGVQVREDRNVGEAGEDVSGPCDEAEHANDPRCSGAGGEQDRRGRDGSFEDRSGPSENSGPSSGSGPSEDSGPGSDDSGPGSDDSGHGGGDSGHGGNSGRGSDD